ncbi:MAG: hypothetical protein QF449_14950 [Alphaproteobacteria bacterium]|nr:hypothetical protein [Alphaproteobacteria bacterium]MDP6819320.1 hypothetical protein [Alphaproteobacteria bacterium]
MNLRDVKTGERADKHPAKLAAERFDRLVRQFGALAAQYHALQKDCGRAGRNVTPQAMARIAELRRMLDGYEQDLLARANRPGAAP